MIELHRLSAAREPFHLNPDLIQTVESSPDTHILLTSGSKVPVAERVEEVVARVRDWRAGLLSDAMRRAAR